MTASGSLDGPTGAVAPDVAGPVAGAPDVAGPVAGTDAGAAGTAVRGRPGRRWWIAGLGVAALVVVVLAPLASSDPDGLERVAEDLGFLGQARDFFRGLLGGYAIPGVDNAWLSTVLAGLLGVLIVAALVYVLGRVVARRRA